MNDKIMTSKVSRVLKTTKIAATSGVKHLGYLGKRKFSKNKDQLKKDHEAEIGRVLFNGLSQMRGTALKASQLLSLETDLLPEGIRRELSKGCYQVPPINKALVRKVFVQEFGKEASKLFEYFDAEAFAAASLGQVHKAKTNLGKELAVKVQYPGISESINSDLKILSIILSGLSATTQYMPNKEIIKITLDEITHCLNDEVDYEKEAKNTRWFRENLKVNNIRIPEVYDDYSAKKILSTELLIGKHVDDWLKTEPTQQQRNHAGQIIFNAFVYSAFELQALHADPHKGNYLFLNSGEIGMLDFGCVKFIDKSFTENMAELLNAIISGTQKDVFLGYKKLKIFSDDLQYDEYFNDIYPVLGPFQQWISAPYRNNTYDFSLLPPPPTDMNQEKHKSAIKSLHGLTRDQMYFDRSYFGVYQLLRQIGAKVNTENPWIYTKSYQAELE